MIYETPKTEKGNIGVSYVSMEKAIEQAEQMDKDGNVNCYGCSRCSRCSDCSGCSRCSDCSGLRSAKPVVSTLGAPVIPVIEDIHKKIYAAATATADSLNMQTWHTCETTHCRAGWVVHLAGEEGKALETFHNTELAAMLIYKASGYEINPAQFYLGNVDALRDMKSLSEGQ